MKILVLFNGSFPQGLAMSKRLKLYSKGLIELGNEVEIIIPHATESIRSIKNCNLAGIFDGIPFQYLSCSTRRSKNFFKRRIDDFVGYLKLLVFILFKDSRPDIIFLIDIRNGWRLPIYLCSKLVGAKVIYELNEHPLVFSSKIKYWIEKLFTYKLFDGYIVISESLKLLLKDIVKKGCVILKVPIINEGKIYDLDSLAINSDLQKNYIIHSGGLIESKEGISTILKSIHLVNINSNFDLHIYFTGDLSSSNDKELINKTIIKLGLSNHVKFLGYLNDLELNNYQFNSILSLLIKPNNLQNNYCFPTKLGEYMAFAKPIIATNVGEYMNYLKDNFNALIVANDDPAKIAENILKLLRNKELRHNMGNNAKLTSDIYFNYKVQAKNINSYFFDIIKQNE